MSLVTILEKARKQLAAFTVQEQRAFHNALARFTAASPLDRRKMLKDVTATHGRHQVHWSLRASRKHRVLLDRENDTYVVRGFVSRGDHRYYNTE